MNNYKLYKINILTYKYIYTTYYGENKNKIFRPTEEEIGTIY